MKKYGFFLAMLTLVIAGASTSQAYDRTGYRYKAKYSDFDRGFSRTYGYTDECYTEYRRHSTRTTCYDMDPYEYVYVQEQVYYDSYGRRYTRVTTYRDEYGSRPIAYYDCYEDSGYGRRVVSREYYDDGYYYGGHRHWQHEHYTTVWVVNLDWNQWETKVFVGAYTSLLGIDILVHSNGGIDTLIGAGLVILGKLKKHQGLEQRASELQKGIDAAQKEHSLDTFETVK